MSMYLAIHEAPCVGVAPVAFDADTDAQAEVYAFEQSVTEPHFVIGGYDLYRIVWNPHTHVHELTPVTPESACTEDVAPEDYEILPCDLDPFGECPKPEYARDCAKCRGWTESEAYKAVHCNWCGWSGDEADLDMNEHDEPTYCPVCGHSVCIADG